MSVPPWVWGVSLSFCGCALSNFGINIQKLAHQRLEQRKADGLAKRSIMCDPYWIGGFLCVLIGSLSDLASFTFADMSLLAPLGAMTLVINMMIAPCLVGEKLTRRDIVWTCVIVTGTVISITFGNKEETEYTLGQLLDFYQETQFVVYFIVFLSYVFGTFGALWYYQNRQRASDRTRGWIRWHAFAYPSLAGAFGAHSVLFAKSGGELVRVTSRGNNQFSHPVSYVIILLMVVSLVLQMRLLNAGLKHADALFVVPVYQVCWVIMNCIVGMTYFKDYENMSALQILAFVVGVIITLVGVRCLSQREMSSPRSGNDPVQPPPATRQRRASTTTFTPVPFHHSYDPLPPDATGGDGMLGNFAAASDELDLEGMSVVTEEPLGYVASPTSSRTSSTYSHHSNSSAVSDDDALTSLSPHTNNVNNLNKLTGVLSPVGLVSPASGADENGPLVGHHHHHSHMAPRVGRNDDMRL